jgi:hypothetical protein
MAALPLLQVKTGGRYSISMFKDGGGGCNRFLGMGFP